MADPVVVLSVTSRQYTPRNISLTPNIPAGVKEITASLSRESWPAGDVVKIEFLSPDGQPMSSATFAGGVATQRNGVVRTADAFTVRGVDGADIAPGVYTVNVTVLQTMRTAVTVTRT